MGPTRHRAARCQLFSMKTNQRELIEADAIVTGAAMKFNMIVLSLVVVVALVCATVAEDSAHEEASTTPHWDYKDQGDWGKEYPLCKGKDMRQSPIDILLDEVHYKPDYSLEFVDYDQEFRFSFKNTHHSVSLSPNPSDTPPALKLSWLPGEFELQEIHFHWGDGHIKGSEHMINHQRAAAEMHMVHFKKGVTKEEIGKIHDSVAVVGVFIESDSFEHNKLEALVKDVALVNGTDEVKASDDSKNLIDLLPYYHHSFYTYNGSLTTPPCLEVVTWVVLSAPVYMSNDKLIELSNLEAIGPSQSKFKISSNHRDVQPLLGRPVFASFNVTESISPELIKDTTGHDYLSKIKGAMRLRELLKKWGFLS